MKNKMCVTEFLGVPVDGTKQEVFSALEKKGFTKVDEDTLSGNFLGKQCEVSVGLHSDKVYVVYVLNEETLDGETAKMEFNNLFMTFSIDAEYSYGGGKSIPHNEDLESFFSKENKSYLCWFHQVGDGSTDLEKRRVVIMLYRMEPNRYSVSLGYFNNYNSPRFVLKLLSADPNNNHSGDDN